MSENESNPIYLSVDEAKREAQVKEPLPGYWRGILSAFICAYLFVVIVWFMGNSKFKLMLVNFTWKPMAAFGWYQNWSLFSPGVRHISFHETAVITFKDGSTKIYEYPRMEKMSVVERFRREKLRKMFVDNMPWPGYEQFLPVFARHLVRANYTQANPPVLVTFVFNVKEKPDPTKHGVIPRSEPPFHTDKTITFVYRVRAGDFEPQAAGSRIGIEQFSYGGRLE